MQFAKNEVQSKTSNFTIVKDQKKTEITDWTNPNNFRSKGRNFKSVFV